MPFPGIFCAGMRARRAVRARSSRSARTGAARSEPGSSTASVAVEQQVEIDRPRPPASAVPARGRAAARRRAAGRAAARGRARSRARRPRSGSAADPRSPTARSRGSSTAGRAPIKSAACPDQRLAVAEIRAETDVGEGHRPRDGDRAELDRAAPPAAPPACARAHAPTRGRTVRRACRRRPRPGLRAGRTAARSPRGPPRRPACSRRRPPAGRSRRASPTSSSTS